MNDAKALQETVDKEMLEFWAIEKNSTKKARSAEGDGDAEEMQAEDAPYIPANLGETPTLRCILSRATSSPSRDTDRIKKKLVIDLTQGGKTEREVAEKVEKREMKAEKKELAEQAAMEPQDQDKEAVCSGNRPNPIQKIAIERRMRRNNVSKHIAQEMKNMRREMESQKERAETTGKVKTAEDMGAQQPHKKRERERKTATAENKRRDLEKIAEKRSTKERTEEVVNGAQTAYRDEKDEWLALLWSHRRAKREEDKVRRSNRKQCDSWRAESFPAPPREKLTPWEGPRQFTSEIMKRQMAEVEREENEKLRREMKEQRHLREVVISLRYHYSWERMPSKKGLTRIYYRQKELSEFREFHEERKKRKWQEREAKRKFVESRGCYQDCEEDGWEEAEVFNDDEDTSVLNEVEAGVETVAKEVAGTCKKGAEAQLDDGTVLFVLSATVGGGTIPIGKESHHRVRTTTEGPYGASKAASVEAAIEHVKAKRGEGLAAETEKRKKAKRLTRKANSPTKGAAEDVTAETTGLKGIRQRERRAKRRSQNVGTEAAGGENRDWLQRLEQTEKKLIEQTAARHKLEAEFLRQIRKRTAIELGLGEDDGGTRAEATLEACRLRRSWWCDKHWKTSKTNNGPMNSKTSMTGNSGSTRQSEGKAGRTDHGGSGRNNPNDNPKDDPENGSSEDPVTAETGKANESETAETSRQHIKILTIRGALTGDILCQFQAVEDTTVQQVK